MPVFDKYCSKCCKKVEELFYAENLDRWVCCECLVKCH